MKKIIQRETFTTLGGVVDEPLERYGTRCGYFNQTPEELGIRDNPEFLRGLRIGRRERRYYNDRLLTTARMVINNCRSVRQIRGECHMLSDEIAKLRDKHSRLFLRNGSFIDIKQSDYHASRQHLKSMQRRHEAAVDAYNHELLRLLSVRGLRSADDAIFG